MTKKLGRILLFSYFGFGDTVIKPGALYAGQVVSQVIPGLVVEGTAFMIMANIVGSVPALLSAFLVIQFLRPPGGYDQTQLHSAHTEPRPSGVA